jgi:hypothetical protein
MNDLGQQQNPFPASNNPQAIGSQSLVQQESDLQQSTGKTGAQLPEASGSLKVVTACTTNCSGSTEVLAATTTKSQSGIQIFPIALVVVAAIFVIWLARSLKPGGPK